MLEYFTYKKYKKHQDEKKHSAPSTPTVAASVPTPVLTAEDEHFLQRVVSAEGTPPPLPDRPRHETLKEAGNSEGNDAQMVVSDKKGKGKEKEVADDKHKAKSNRFSFLGRSGTKKDKKTPPANISPEEASKEAQDISKVLEDLNLSAVNNRAFSLSNESQVLVQKFTVVLKDLINGVPTAYDDLVGLLDSSSGQLNKSYESLPDFIKKLITSLPEKVKGNLAPELLAVAAEAQGFGKGSASTSSTGAGFGAAAKNFLKPTSLKDLVTKPGAVVGMLRTILNTLKLRWPAFMGTNVLLSVALFVLLFVFWYCHKRGREVRLEKEAKVDSEGRVVELDDEPMLEQPVPAESRSRSREPRRSADERVHEKERR